MKLTDPTLDELDRAFAEHVAGWNKIGPDFQQRIYGELWIKDGTTISAPPHFTRSFDAVLPWLEKCREIGRRIHCEMGFKRWRIWIHDKQPSGLYLSGDREADGDSESFPLAAVIALLRANGHEITFTK